MGFSASALPSNIVISGLIKTFTNKYC